MVPRPAAKPANYCPIQHQALGPRYIFGRFVSKFVPWSGAPSPGGHSRNLDKNLPGLERGPRMYNLKLSPHISVTTFSLCIEPEHYWMNLDLHYTADLQSIAVIVAHLRSSSRIRSSGGYPRMQPLQLFPQVILSI